MAAVLTVTLLLACTGEADPDALANGAVAVGDPQIGSALLARSNYGCGACHVIPGVPNARGVTGPPLDLFAERTRLVAGLPNEPETVIAFIVDPPRFAPHTAMPATGVSPEEARHMAAYLYTLDGEALGWFERQWRNWGWEAWL